MNRVDTCGAACRKQTRQQRGDGQHDCGRDEQEWIVRRNLIKLRCEQATDGEWCRRLYLDVIGRIPTVDELNRFLSDHTANRRANPTKENSF